MLRKQYIRLGRVLVHSLSGSLGVALLTVVCLRLDFDLATTACLYLIIIVLLSLQGSYLSSAIISLLSVSCLAYYFAPPIFSIRISDPINTLVIVAFFTTSAVITHLSSRLRKSEEQEFNMRLEERVTERIRIARELHDTLLRSLETLMLSFQAVDELLPERADEGKKLLEGALHSATQTIAEAQDAVHELRSSTVVTYDLAAAVTALGTQLAVQHANDSDLYDLPTFLVEVEGMPKDLDPILRDEIYRIAGKALRHAFHKRPNRIEVEIRYDQPQFRLRIRDEGSGVSAGVLNHETWMEQWGLNGMRERARHIGAELAIQSLPESGTEMELLIPASIAYQTSAGRGFRWFPKKTGTG